MSADGGVETKYCSNCKKDIAASNFTMHEVHCRRHLVLCELCKEPVPRTEMEEHFNEVHAKVPCKLCSVELEKDQLDAHLENECPKRVVSCEFCELEMPHSDLAAHVEFCGTRTEACPRCGNFIMHKDLQRHNSSNCSYPEAKPPPRHANDFHNRGGGDDRRIPLRTRARRPVVPRCFQELDDSFDPFGFEEVRQALERSERHGDGGGGMPSMVVPDSDASAAAGFGRRGRGVKNTTSVPGVKKNDTRGGTRKVTTNRKSEVNHQRERASSPVIPPDVDYDTMMAMQLASEEEDNLAAILGSDPDPDADLNQLINNYEKRSRQQSRFQPIQCDDDISVPASPPPDDFAPADEDMIPCEFCHESFPAFALVHHQSVCDPLVSGLWGEGQVAPASAGQNNEAPLENTWVPAGDRPPAIPVINNLGSASPAQDHEGELNYHLTDNGDHLFNSLENIMLPCEFCNELLPADSLVQHQAMCEANTQATPRVMTPAAALPSAAISPTAGPTQFQFFPTEALSSSRRGRPDPTEELWSAISQAGQENEIRPKKRPNVSKTNNPGASRNLARPSNRSTQDDEDIHAPARGGRQVSRDSASRARHTLNSLLADDVAEERSSEGPRRRNNNPSSLSTGVSSRTVMRSMQDQRRRPQQSRAEDTTAEETDPLVRRGLQRERGDHLFNSTGHARNPANQNRPKRSSNRQVHTDWS